MLRNVAAALALALFATIVVPVLTAGNPAEAGCTRVYTTSGWITRC